MSGMSSILGIPLYREVPSPHESNEKGNGRSGRHHPKELFPLQFSSLGEESSPVWMDPEHAAHAAHVK